MTDREWADRDLEHIATRHMLLEPLAAVYVGLGELGERFIGQTMTDDTAREMKLHIESLIYAATETASLAYSRPAYRADLFFEDAAMVFELSIEHTSGTRWGVAVRADDLWDDVLDGVWLNPMAVQSRFVPVRFTVQNGRVVSGTPDLWDPLELRELRKHRAQQRGILA